MKLIKRLIAWLNEPQPTLGCPDPELHDRNNEARHGRIISECLVREKPVLLIDEKGNGFKAFNRFKIFR